MSTNTPLIIAMVSTIGLSVTAMVLSSISAKAAAECKCSDDTAHSYATYTAVVCGLSAAAVAVALALYIYREPIVSSLSDMVKAKSM